MEELSPEESNLTPKELLFVNYYLSNNLNSASAAKMAGYSEASAYELGHRLLRKVEIKKVIDQYLKNESIESLEVLKRLSDVAKNKGTEFINQDGTVDLEAIKANGMMHLIRSIRKGKGGKLHITFHDSMRAIETLAKIHKLVSDGLNVTVNIEDHILAERELSAKLAQIEEKMMNDPIEKQVYDYRQQLVKEQKNHAT